MQQADGMRIVALALWVMGCGPSDGEDDSNAMPDDPNDMDTDMGSGGTGGGGGGTPPGTPAGEACDEIGATRECYPGDAASAGVGACARGGQTCEGDEEFRQWTECAGAVLPGTETCNDVDDDCDGMTDEDLPACNVVEVPVNIDGDCVTASCPAEAPYPVGCDIEMDGGDDRGCVASSPSNPVVYFQEGDVCGAGHVEGTLYCSSNVGSGLNESNCVINKSVRYYPTDRSGCPDT